MIVPLLVIGLHKGGSVASVMLVPLGIDIIPLSLTTPRASLLYEGTLFW